MRRLAGVLLMLSVPCVALASGPGVDGRWLLTIRGDQSFVFGEPGFGGGVRIPWEILIDFEVRQGEYRIGSGNARWLNQITSLSRPQAWFDCRKVNGTYLDSNLTLHETPRVRFAAFPVAGVVHEGRIELRPGYVPPGNYLAVTYRCATDNPLAENWFSIAERGKQVFGKRQDAEPRRDGVAQTVRVREVAALPPEAGLELPLSDGWVFAQSDGSRRARFELRKLE